MTIPLEQAQNMARSLQQGRIQNLFAQTHARHVLYEVNESPNNFPDFDTQLDDKVTFAAYALLAAGCSMLEQHSIEEGRRELERAASLLQNTHGPFAGELRTSSFHLLVSAMAFFASGHYSRAFVYIREAETVTEIAGAIASFLRKDIDDLIKRISSILLQDTPQFVDRSDLDEWVITVAIARSLAFVLEFIFTGNDELLDQANLTLDDAYIIATEGASPAYWCIVRLLKLMYGNVENASLWKTITPFFDPESAVQLRKYIQLLAFSEPPIFELWTSQIESLSLALDPSNRGGVISLRTSAGKTRVAELAIFQTLVSNPDARVIYLAPFRSLAFEVEKTLSASLSWLGFQVSQLYGGSRVSAADTELMSESSIIIATPEKTRAIFRAFPELFGSVKLIVIDEGHLIGPSERFVRNEIFIEHLRAISRKSDTRILLLSAVLPNVQEAAEWIASDQENFVASQWKPSAERFGELRWDGKKVRINWHGEFESFNPSFVEAKPTSSRKNSRLFPRTKPEAVAATAVRLSNLGPVMIFAGQAQWVPSMARNVMHAMGNDAPTHNWPGREWSVFEAVCIEELEPGAVELAAAKLGIICHSNNLPAQVRLATEVLMRSYPPKIIIATTTLGQGVNVGISSIIINTPYIGNNKTIDKRDFWNICGRAGRAFVDGEGKILYAIDDTRTAKQIKADVKLAQGYFDVNDSEYVESGLLALINELRLIAMRANVSFEVLLELVANNDFKVLGDQSKHFELKLDLIDDGLLALHEDYALADDSIDDSMDWIDEAFRESLASIQSREELNESSSDDVIRFLKARTSSNLTRVPNRSARKAIISSALPLSAAIQATEDADYFRALVDEYIDSDRSLQDLATVVREIESWARIYAFSVTGNMPAERSLENLRIGWLGGTGLRTLIQLDSKAVDISKGFYGYQLPWIIHAISHTLDKEMEAERIAILSQIALLVEIGVPSDVAANIFLAGIRSREAVTELANLDIQFGSSISSIREMLSNPLIVQTLISQVSPSTGDWLYLLLNDRLPRRRSEPVFSGFRLEQTVEEDALYARTLGDDVFLCTLGGRIITSVDPSTEMPFDRVADDPRFAFSQTDDVWKLDIRDPRLES